MFHDTIVAHSTAPGLAALAIIRLSGADAFRLADKLFHAKKPLTDAKSHTLHYGLLQTPDGQLLDEVVAAVYRSPHSYTGEDVVEITCHGSPFIQQQILQAFLQSGARLANPGEFTLRAFLNGRMDLSQAEAVADLINAENQAAHQIALQQLRGGFKTEIAQLREQLIHFASLVELELDFSEEDVEFADRSALKELVYTIRNYLGRLLESFNLGNALKTGVLTVIAGRPNAGKSTLLNALLNEERALVSDLAGTTRDTIEEVLYIRGVAFRLVDTAGLRDATDTIERMGVERALEKVRAASVLLYLWDVSTLTLAEVYYDLENLLRQAPGLQLLVLCNKMDRNPYFRPEWLLNPADPDIFPYLQSDPPAQNTIGLTADQIMTLSARNGQNIHYLKEKLFETAVGQTPTPDQTIVTNARHHDALQRADQALSDVLHALDTGISGDFIAQDIRRALHALGEITGAIGVEDLLGNIFGKFCIGK